MIRRQLPVHSPLPFRAVLGGLRGLTDPSAAWRDVRRALAERFGTTEILLTDSGTTALALALRAVSSEAPDRPVALPAYCCYDVATAAVGADVPVVLYDVDPATLSPDPASLRRVLGEQETAALVVAHLYGIPVDLGTVAGIAAEAGVPLIEDAAQAAGGRIGGRPLGTFGSLVVLSFGRGKGTTGCGGGALLGRDARGRSWVDDVTATLSDGSSRGWRRLPALVGQWALGRPSLYGLPASVPLLGLGDTVYREPSPPERMSALSAGTLTVTLPVDAEGDELTHRRELAARWRRLVDETEGVAAVSSPAASEPGFLRFPVLADREVADRLAAGRWEPLGVMPGYPRALHRLPALQGHLVGRAGALEGAEVLTDRLFTLPTHSRVTADDIGAIEAGLRG